MRRIDEYAWELPKKGPMRVPGVIYGDRDLVDAMDDKVAEQLGNVATLPGIVEAAYAMPDAHWGYGFPIGGVAAFDADEGGVVSAGGVGFDISCGVRALHTGLRREDIVEHREAIADALFLAIPAGMGATGELRLTNREMDAMLLGGARWAVEAGYGRSGDLERIEEGGQASGAEPGAVSNKAKTRQRKAMGTLGSGNHYLELQHVTAIHDEAAARAFGLARGDVVISIHCGSRGLGHQIGTEFLKEMVVAAGRHGITLPDRELACAPIRSELGARYLGAMRAAINCALANRQILTHLTREAFAELFPGAGLPLLYDVSHNTCKVERHTVDGIRRELHVHRKGATRAFGPGHPALPSGLREVGQPVLIGGTMGTASYVLVGADTSEERSFASACHGAGRAMSRSQASKQWTGRALVDELAQRGIEIRAPSLRGVAEEAPGAYKDVSAVVEAADRAGLARLVARLEPIVTIKG
ncbi:MAG: RtcB family protein [Myxococcales bacterium]|nr:RtcB family protein [Myxococcales bacterium]